MSRKPLVRRIIPYAVLGVALVSGVLAVRPAIAWLDSQLARLQASMVEAIERATGLELHYSAISPSLLLRADISDVRLLRPDGTVFFRADRVRIAYNLLDFLFKTPIEAVRGVETSGSELFFDFDVDGKRFSPSQEPAAPLDFDQLPEQISAVLDQVGRYVPPGIAFEFDDTHVVLSAQGSTFDFSLGRVGLSTAPERLALQLDLSLDRAFSAGDSLVSSLSGKIRFDGQYFRNTRQLQTRLASGAVTTPWGELSPQNFALFIEPGAIRLTRLVDREPIDLQLVWQLAERTIGLSLQADKLELARLFAFKGDPGAIGGLLLGGEYTTELRASWLIGSAMPELALTLSARSALRQPGDTRLELDLEATGGALPVGQLSLEMPGLALRAGAGSADQAACVGDFALELDPSLIRVPAMLGGGFRLQRLPDGVELALPGLFLNLDGHGLAMEEARAAYRGGRFLFGLALANPQGGEADGGLSFSGSGTADSLELSLSAQAFALKPLLPLARPLAMAAGLGDPGEIAPSAMPDDLSLSCQAALKKRGELSVRIADFRIELAAYAGTGKTESLFQTALSLDGRQLSVDKTLIRFGGLQLDLVGKAASDAAGATSLSIDITDELGNAYPIRAYHAPDGTFNLQGPYSLFLNGKEALAAGNGIKAVANLQNLPLPVLGEKAGLSCMASVHWDGKAAWQLDLLSLDLRGVPSQLADASQVGRLTLRDARFDPEGLRIGSLRFQDSLGALEGEGTLRWRNEGFSSGDFGLDLAAVPVLPILGSLPKENLKLEGSFDAQGIKAALVWDQGSLARLLGSTVKGAFRLEAALDGGPAPIDPGALSVQGSFKTVNAFLNKDAVDATAQFKYRSGVVELRDMGLALLEHRVSVGQASVDLAQGRVQIGAEYRTTNPNAQSVKLSGTAQWNPRKATIQAMVFDEFAARLQAFKVPDLEGRFADYDVVFQGKGQLLSFTEQNHQALRGWVKPDGAFQARAQDPLPLSCLAEGQLAGSQIEATITNIKADIGRFSRFLNLEVFRLNGGILNGALRVIGDINDPELYGTLYGSDIKAAVSFIPEPLLAKEGVLVFEEKQVRLFPLNVTAGASSALVEGEFGISRLNIDSVNLRTTVPLEAQGVHVKGKFPLVLVDGWAKGKLGIAWRGNTMIFNGQLRVDDASLELELLQFGRQELKPDPAQADAEPFYYDVNLSFQSGKSVEFFLPNRSLPIFRTQFDPNQEVKLVYNSLRGNWSLVGNLKSRGGELIYLKRNFLLREASLVFNENQDKFDPLVSGRAETRMSADGRPVRVSLVLENSLLSKLTPRIITDLPLSNDQITALLTGDIVRPASAGTLSGNDLLNSVAGAANQFWIVDPIINKEILGPLRTTLGLDVLNARTDFLSKLIIDSASRLTGVTPLDNQSISVGKYLDNTTIHAGKFFGEDLYGEVVTRLAEVPMGNLNPSSLPADLAGWLSAISGLTGVGVELELGMEWNTPYFDIGWSSSLKDLSSVDKWLKNNAFSISWRLQ